MPKITLNGQPCEFDPGQSVIELAKCQGTDIPHYCWHPALSVAASCRMCLVEIKGSGPERPPRMVTACNTECVDGMVVETESPSISRARAGNLEALLLNHPLDCPICDKAGECWLQDYTYEYGAAAGRNEFDRRKKQKRVDISEHVLLDQERCILCTRCVRFLDDYVHKPELVVTERGAESVIEIFPGHPVENDYQGNLADICPVGALTLKEFRFKNRVWHLEGTDTVCPSCSRGCAITLDVRRHESNLALDRELNRVRPRTNLEVNGYFICDQGRFGLLKKYRPEERLETALRAGAPADLSAVIGEAARRLRELSGGDLLVVASTDATNEELLLARQLFQDANLGQKPGLLFVKPPTTKGDGILRTGQPWANLAGLEQLGFKGYARKTIQKRVGDCAALVMLGSDLDLSDHRPGLVIAQTLCRTVAAGADLAWPGQTVGEKDGSFTNCDGRTQRVRPALRAPAPIRGDFESLLALGRALALNDLPATPAEAFLIFAGDQGVSGQTLAALPADGLLLGEQADAKSRRRELKT